MTESPTYNENQNKASGKSFNPTRCDVTDGIIKLLAQRHDISQQQIDNLLHRVKWSDDSIYDLLINENILSESQLLELVSEISGIPFQNLIHTEIEPESVQYLNCKIATKYRIMPLKIAKGILFIASDHIPDTNEKEQLRLILGLRLEWRLCTPKDLNECIKHYYGVAVETFMQLPTAASQDSPVEEQSYIAIFVRRIIEDAAKANATDIHFEPMSDGLKLRYRIDGVLSHVTLPEGASRFAKPIISSLKVMAQLNIAEKRLPQDGRFSVMIDEREIDLRVSVLPSSHGEGVNIRILKKEGTFMSLPELGLGRKQLKELNKLIEKPHGIILFTGPTGSGKTTSLYASLSILNDNKRKIITLEDPVEYDINGIMQLQVNQAIGFTFATGLRSVLRHDPDVVLIGEIRDNETAEIAISSALTGHLVFSTLHTNDSAGAIMRLTDMGIEPYLTASSVIGAVAQRLVRKICPSCKKEYALEPQIKERILAQYTGINESLMFFKGAGCPDCRFTGYKGRQALFEILTLNDELRKLVVTHGSTSDMMQLATLQGLVPLRETGIKSAAKGITTVEEVLRVT